MVHGFTGIKTPLSVNFWRSRAGLQTVGYTVLDAVGQVFIPRTTAGIAEVVVNGVNTGVYTVEIIFPDPFEGFIVWDTGQAANGQGLAALRFVQDEVLISIPVGGEALAALTFAVEALYDENTMKVFDGVSPTKIRLVRKRTMDADWSQPYSDKEIHIVRTPGQERYGGPAPL